jgi:hypothetical protein
MSSFQPHHINFVAHLLKAGLVDGSAGIVAADLLAAAREMLQATSTKATSTKAVSATPTQRAVLEKLAAGPCLAIHVDGRTLKALRTRGLIKITLSSDPGLLQSLTQPSDVHVEGPRSVVHLTDTGRAMMVPCPTSTSTSP